MKIYLGIDAGSVASKPAVLGSRSKLSLDGQVLTHWGGRCNLWQEVQEVKGK